MNSQRIKPGTHYFSVEIATSVTTCESEAKAIETVKGSFYGTVWEHLEGAYSKPLYVWSNHRLYHVGEEVIEE